MDAAAAIASIPSAHLATAYDGLGEAHECAVVGVTDSLKASDYGLEPMDAPATVYVALPFVAPRDGRLRLVLADGSDAVWRVETVASYTGLFCTLQLSGRCGNV